MEYDKTNLSVSLGLATGIVPAKAPRPILSCARIVEHTITTCNLEQQWIVENNERTKDQYCVDASRLLKIVKAAPEDQIVIKGSDHVITVMSGYANSRMETMPIMDFPTITPEAEHLRQVTIPAATIQAMLKPSYAMAVDDVRYYLKGLCLHSIAGDGLYSVGSDGRRLASCKATGIECDDDWQIILPIKTVQEIRKGLQYAPGEPVQIRIYKGAAEIRFGETATLTTKLVDGTFPDWRRIIPPDRHQSKMKRDDLLDALKRCAIFGEAGVLIQVEKYKSALRVGETHCDFIESVAQGEPASIGLSVALITGLVTAVEGEDITIDYGAEGGAIKVTDGNTTHILMPMRL